MISFRKVVESDELFLIDLYGSTRDDVLKFGGHLSRDERFAFVSQQYQLQQLHYKNHNPKASFLIITLEGKDIGRLTYNHSENDLWIIEFSLVPTFRSMGLGHQVIAYLEQLIQSQGSLGLYVAKSNEKALSFYKGLGFEMEKSEFELYERMVKHLVKGQVA